MQRRTVLFDFTRSGGKPTACPCHLELPYGDVALTQEREERGPSGRSVGGIARLEREFATLGQHAAVRSIPVWNSAEGRGLLLLRLDRLDDTGEHVSQRDGNLVEPARLELQFPIDYPFAPMRARLENMPFPHPNVKANGVVCVGFGQETWVSSRTTADLIDVLVAAMRVPHRLDDIRDGSLCGNREALLRGRSLLLRSWRSIKGSAGSYLQISYQ